MTKRKNTLNRWGWVEKIGDWLRLSVPFATTVMFDRDTLEQKLSEISAFSEDHAEYKAVVHSDAHPVRFTVERIRPTAKRELEAYITGQWIGENGIQGIDITGRVYPNVFIILLIIFWGVFLFLAFDRHIIVALIVLFIAGFYIKSSLKERDKTLEFFMDYLHDKAKYKNAPSKKRS